MTIRALSRFGVMGWPREEVRAVLDLANDFRRELVALYQERHERSIDLRNEHFPALFAALAEAQSAYYRCREIEAEIKRLHSAERNRNVRTDEQEDALRTARQRLKIAKKIIAREAKARKNTLRAHSLWWNSLADWKNVKTLAKRRELYASVLPPDSAALARIDASEAAKPRKPIKGKDAKERKQLDTSLVNLRALAAYAAMDMAMDLRERELQKRFQAAGLHSAIRIEIVAASQPKLGKDGPGIRYRYGQCQRLMRDLRLWGKITLQFGGGGISIEEAHEGRSDFALEPLWVNETRSGPRAMYRVRQQIGTAGHPRMIEYKMRLDAPWPPGIIVKRWSLSVEETEHVTLAGNRTLKAYAIPTVAVEQQKPHGKGLAGYRLRWTRRAAGVEVAHIYGAHVNERVILPNRIVEDRMCVAEEQSRCDLLADAMLTARGAMPPAGQKQGLEALAVYAAKHPLDNGVANTLANCRDALMAARKVAKRAERTIVDIYRKVAARVCRVHDALWHDPINLKAIKRYDTRDLLKDDPLPAKSREYLHAVAPGKLRAAMKAYGLAASSEEPQRPAGDARETDLFTSYVGSLHRATGKRELPKCRRSQIDAQVESA